MPIESKAIIRVLQANWDGSAREDRIFKRPGGGFSRASYPDENTPDDRPIETPDEIRAGNAALIIKLMTGQDLEDFE